MVSTEGDIIHVTLPDAEFTGQVFSFPINRTYLSDAVIKGGFATVHVGNEGAPIRFTRGDDLYVAMPLRGESSGKTTEYISRVFGAAEGKPEEPVTVEPVPEPPVAEPEPAPVTEPEATTEEQSQETQPEKPDLTLVDPMVQLTEQADTVAAQLKDAMAAVRELKKSAKAAVRDVRRKEKQLDAREREIRSITDQITKLAG